MPRVLTNNLGLSVVQETSLGIPGTTGWLQLEPNSLTAWGATLTTTPRAPISKNRQRRKGRPTDLNSAVGYEADLTLSSFRRFIDGFVFADGIGSDITGLASTAASTTNDEYTVTALIAGQADKLNSGTLLWVTGFDDPENNGLKEVDADIATGATTITVGQNLVTESGASGVVSLAGYQTGTAVWTYSSTTKRGTLTLTGLGTAVEAVGLVPGQFVHFGSVAAAGDDLDNGIMDTQSPAVEQFGFGRVRSISSGSIVFDKLSSDLQVGGLATGQAVDLVFGEFFRNVATDDADYAEISYQLEAAFPNLGAAGVTEYEYAKGNYANQLGFNVPLTEKSTLTLGFIGTDTDTPTATRKTGASAARAPRRTTSFSTSADVARLRITEIDEDGITTDFKSLTLTINNNASGEKVVGTLGSKFVNVGSFFVNLEAQMLFTSGAVIEAIRNGDSVTLDFVLKNEDGVIAVDIPSMTMGGGSREFPLNQSVLVSITAEAEEDDIFGTSLGISLFPVPIP